MGQIDIIIIVNLLTGLLGLWCGLFFASFSAVVVYLIFTLKTNWEAVNRFSICIIVIQEAQLAKERIENEMKGDPKLMADNPEGSYELPEMQIVILFNSKILI